MSLHLFLRHLKAGRWGLVAWSGLMGLYALLVFYLYPTMKAAGYEQMFEKLPESIKALAGLQNLPAGVGLSLETFMSVEFLGSWAALVAVYAVFAAGGVVAREVERGTMDLILAQPLTRTRLVLSKFAVFLTGVGIIALGSLVGILAGIVLTAEKISLGNTALALFQGWSLVLAVGSYSLLFSCLTLDPRRTLLLSGTITAVFYILNSQLHGSRPEVLHLDGQVLPFPLLCSGGHPAHGPAGLGGPGDILGPGPSLPRPLPGRLPQAGYRGLRGGTLPPSRLRKAFQTATPRGMLWGNGDGEGKGIGPGPGPD